MQLFTAQLVLLFDATTSKWLGLRIELWVCTQMVAGLQLVLSEGARARMTAPDLCLWSSLGPCTPPHAQANAEAVRLLRPANPSMWQKAASTPHLNASTLRTKYLASPDL